MNPEVHRIREINWQFFCTFTLKRDSAPEKYALSAWFAVLRALSRWASVHGDNLIWVLRRELGESTGRRHYHALIAGLPLSFVQVRTCFSIMNEWEKQGGGMARVRVFDALLDGVEYTLKAVEATELAAARAGANNYELHKFGGSCEIMLSKSIRRVLAGRRPLIGKRLRPTLDKAEQDRVQVDGQWRDVSALHRSLFPVG